MTNFRNTNLNLLPVLRELLRHRNVTHAARALNLSQPATSEALARLRHLLHDDILIPSGRTFIPSALAARILPRLEVVLGELEALIMPSEFDPSLSHGAIKIAASDNNLYLFGGSLTRKVLDAAPNMNVEFSGLSTKIADELRTGELDLVVSPQLLEGLSNTPLFEDDLVCVLDADSAGVKLSPQDFIERRVVIFSSPGSVSHTLVETLLRQAGIVEYNAIRVPSFLLVPPMVESTRNIAVMGRRLASRLSKTARICSLPPPVDFPKVRFIMSWSPAKEHDPGHIWLRELMLQVVSELVC
jgi:DNA-binding transcriptional LysR family regulator